MENFLHYCPLCAGKPPIAMDSPHKCPVMRISDVFGVACPRESCWTIRTAGYLRRHHDDVIKWKHFPRYWPFGRGIHRSPVNSPYKDQWRGALMFSLICALNKRLSKQSWGWWFETPSRSLWRHCSDDAHVTWLYNNVAGDLQIGYIQDTDDGTYECIAENDLGVAYSNPARLIVEGKRTGHVYRTWRRRGNTFRIINPLWGESTGHRCILAILIKGQWWRALAIFSLLCWRNCWKINRVARDFRRLKTHVRENVSRIYHEYPKLF